MDQHNAQDSETAKDTDAPKPSILEKAEQVKQRQGMRDALRLVSYGLYVLTTAVGEQVHGITFNWLTQLSFEPTLVVAAIENDSHTNSMLVESKLFAINILGKEQTKLANRMATPFKINRHKFSGVPYTVGVSGAPLLESAIAYLECEVRDSVEVPGDHRLYIAEVVAGEVKKKSEPLTLLDSGLRYK